MANLTNFPDMSVYVGTYKKYNEGSLFGKWLKLSDYSDYNELIAAMRDLHKDEADPEFMLQDYEISPIIESMGLISEYHISSEIYKVMEFINGCSFEAATIEAFIDCFGCYDSIEEIIEKMEESYHGQFDSDAAFAENLLSETDSTPKDLPSYVYIDWDRTARDIMYDYSSSNGYYFRNI